MSRIVWDNGVVNSFASVSLEVVIINWVGSDVTQRKAIFNQLEHADKVVFLNIKVVFRSVSHADSSMCHTVVGPGGALHLHFCSTLKVPAPVADPDFPSLEYLITSFNFHRGFPVISCAILLP